LKRDPGIGQKVVSICSMLRVITLVQQLTSRRSTT
jgi:hypothetical protein